MTDEDRVALTVAADRERARILRGPVWERRWMRASIIAGIVVGAGNVVATLWQHR